MRGRRKKTIINASINSYIFLLAILTHHVFNFRRSFSHIHHRVIEHTQSVCIYHEIVYYSEKNRKKSCNGNLCWILLHLCQLLYNFFLVVLYSHSFQLYCNGCESNIVGGEENRMFWQMWSSFFCCVCQNSRCCYS